MGIKAIDVTKQRSPDQGVSALAQDRQVVFRVAGGIWASNTAVLDLAVAQRAGDC
ncbi:hypothetical protein WL1483_2198 [Aeromonas schubertii]|uniref:Uncharacterized protein n=1 Tax=Aeromonas schubertii TaxID=652 RepID=A0A0S2SIS9_9GAMM|nr:hypothetical protein WL1483_2198 [Aeromonas schubertii]